MTKRFMWSALGPDTEVNDATRSLAPGRDRYSHMPAEPQSCAKHVDRLARRDGVDHRGEIVGITRHRVGRNRFRHTTICLTPRLS